MNTKSLNYAPFLLASSIVLTSLSASAGVLFDELPTLSQAAKDSLVAHYDGRTGVDVTGTAVNSWTPVDGNGNPLPAMAISSIQQGAGAADLITYYSSTDTLSFSDTAVGGDGRHLSGSLLNSAGSQFSVFWRGHYEAGAPFANSGTYAYNIGLNSISHQRDDDGSGSYRVELYNGTTYLGDDITAYDGLNTNWTTITSANSHIAYANGTNLNITGSPTYSVPANSAIVVGAYSASGYDLVGDISQILIFQSALSGSDRALVEGYLSRLGTSSAPEKFRVTHIKHVPNGDVDLTWNSVPGNTYTIVGNLNLEGTWADLITGIPANDVSTDHTIPAGITTPNLAEEQAYFFRVRDDGPSVEDFSLQAALNSIDTASKTWWTQKSCVTCHTNGAYLTLPGNVRGSLASWNEVYNGAQTYADSWQASSGDQAQGAVATACFLAIADTEAGLGLQPGTVTALDRALAMQDEAGHWPGWLKCDWYPFESDNHYSVTLMAVALGMAGEPYVSTPQAVTGMTRIRSYFQANDPVQRHHKAMLLWAEAYDDGLISAAQRTQWIDELFALQRADGGWFSVDLGPYDVSHLVTGPAPVNQSDGYGTGFVLFVLRTAGVPETDERIKKAVTWLKNNQLPDGRWWTHSIRNRPGTPHYLSNAGTAFAIKALALCGETVD
jgi:squalene-hopene/tetraprenyl-beta-curcumene cyclase